MKVLVDVFAVCTTSLPISVARPEQPTTTPTVGSCFTPNLVSGVWVGGEERDIHFDNMRDGQGAEMALPIWGLYMNKGYADKSLGYLQTDTFAIPHGFDPCKDILADDEAPAIQESTGLDDLFQ